MTDSYDVHVVPHTHWDREWYHPAGRFRQRLVALVDELLDDRGRNGGSFLLDGQAVVLDDYLAVRPERRDDLALRLREGALEAGPWYVLADELIPGGEALVRNLLAGRQALHALGAAAPPVLYSPDAFGHPAALPLLADGFGCHLIVAWRGFGGRRWPAGDTFSWRAPDGTATLLFHLPPDGYEFGSSLPDDRQAAVERWARMRAVLVPRSRLGVLLVQNGADHHARQRSLDEALRALADVARPDRVLRSSLADFAGALVDRARGADLAAVAGELRDSYGYTWTLQGTFATRAAQKRRNASVERLLARDAEPWAALAWCLGGRSRGAVTRAAWKTLLLCHPHDTLCGCSSDEVADAMDARLDDASTQARGICDDALDDLLGHDPAAARDRRRDWRSVLVARNPAARVRAGVAEVELLAFVRDVPVGPGSAAVARGRGELPPVLSLGGSIPVQHLDRLVRHDRVESPHHYPDDDLVEVHRAVAWLPPIGGYTVRAFPLASGETATSPLPRPVRADHRTLDNGRLRLTVGADGRVRLAAPELEVDIADLVRIESVGDLGDTYTPSLRGEPARARLAGAKVVHRGPLRAVIETRWALTLPAERAEPEARAPGPDRRKVRGPRSLRMVRVPVEVRFTLDAEAPFVRLRATGMNAARDHRLRIVLATGIADPVVVADAAFGPVDRRPLRVPDEDAAREIPPATAPLHRYVSMYGAGPGVSVFSDGLAEYEAMTDGAVAVTLVRAVGELSRPDLPERPGHAGWPMPTPGAQSLGPFAAELAVMPHGPRTSGTAGAVERAADDVLLPLVGTTLRSALRVPAPSGGIELAGDGLAFSAAKESESGEWLVARCVNATSDSVSGAWRFGFPVREARLARLDETPLDVLAIVDGAVPFTAPPRAVVTVLVR